MTVFSLQDQEKTKTSICTFLSVLVHFNILIPNLKDKVNPMSFTIQTPLFFFITSSSDLSIFLFKAAQLRTALNIILQWCFNHNFSVRLYALLALKRVWSFVEEGADGLGGLSAVIRTCLNQAEAMQTTGWAHAMFNIKKSWL